MILTKSYIKSIFLSIVFISQLLLLNCCDKDNPDPNENWQPGDKWVDTRDGQSYKTIEIGSQVWMAENLKATTYTNSSDIPLVEDSLFWDAMDYSYSAYCYYQNKISNIDTYGNLYTWKAAMNAATGNNIDTDVVQGVCPVDWHVPSQSEFLELVEGLGGWEVAGGALKEAGTNNWNEPNTGATNASGFNAIPAGYRHVTGFFNGHGEMATFWSSTIDTFSDDKQSARLIHLYSTIQAVEFNGRAFEFGFSVRCIKDTTR